MLPEEIGEVRPTYCLGESDELFLRSGELIRAMVMMMMVVVMVVMVMVVVIVIACVGGASESGGIAERRKGFEAKKGRADDGFWGGRVESSCGGVMTQKKRVVVVAGSDWNWIMEEAFHLGF